MNTKNIVAMGGGSFASNNSLTAVEKYTLNLTNKPYPKVCFLGTATGDTSIYIDKFYKAFSKEDAYLSHLNIFNRNHKNIEEYLLDQDVIYVGGGNTYNMLLLWKEYGIDKILNSAWAKGIVLCGISAGSLCWFENGNTDSFGDMDQIKCLGFLPYSNSPHYNSEVQRRPNFQQLILDNKIKPGWGVDEDVALHFKDQDLVKVISNKPDVFAYWTETQKEKLIEKKIIPENLNTQK
jgi:dipeptidase E